MRASIVWPTTSMTCRARSLLAAAEHHRPRFITITTGPPMIDQPRIVQSEKQLTAHIPLVVACADMPKVMGPGITEVFNVLAAQGLKPTGPWFTHHRRRPTDSFDFSICVPVATAVKPSGRVSGGLLPAATVAHTVYH